MSASSAVLFSIMEPLSGFEQFYPLPALSVATIIVLPSVIHSEWCAARMGSGTRKHLEQVEEPQTIELDVRGKTAMVHPVFVPLLRVPNVEGAPLMVDDRSQ